MAPFFSRLSMAFCRYSVLFSVRNCLSVLVRTSEFWMTCPEAQKLGSAKPVQTLLSEPLLASLHYQQVPVGGPAFFLSVKGFPPCWLGSLAEKLAAWLLRLEKFWFCWLCWPYWKDCLPSWLTGGPNLWCTDNLEVPAALGAGFLGTLKCVVRPLWRECCCCMVKIFASNSLILGPKRF